MPRLYERWRIVCVIGACAWFTQACGASQAPHRQTSARATVAGAPGTLSLTRGDWPVELAQNVEWKRASLGDEWALLGVARQRQMLSTQLERGGPAAGVAARAWPLAPAAWVERGSLCRVVLRYAEEDWGSLLAALRQSSSFEDAVGEVLDVDAKSDCENMLAALEQRTSGMSPSVFDEYAAACQALGRSAP